MIFDQIFKIILSVAQFVFSGALVLVTGILAAITFAYMLFTRKMAKSMAAQSEIMTREFELRIAPLLDLSWHKRIHSLKPYVEITVKNVGYYPIYFSHVSYKYWERQDPNNNSISANHDVEKWIEKGKSCKERITFDFTALKNFPTLADIKDKGMAEFTGHFRTSSGEKFKRPKRKIITF